MDILKRYIENNYLYEGLYEEEISQYLIEYLDKQNEKDIYYSIFKLNRDIQNNKLYDIDDIRKDPIKYIRFVYSNKTERFFEYDDTKGLFIPELTLTRENKGKFSLKNKKKLLQKNNIEDIFGYIQKLKGKLEFYTTNNIGIQIERDEIGNIKNQKLIRKGAKCGSGLNLKKKVNFTKAINKLLGYVDGSDLTEYIKYTQNKNTKELCQILEIILRYNQYNSGKYEFNKNNTYYRFFYRPDEVFTYM